MASSSKEEEVRCPLEDEKGNKHAANKTTGGWTGFQPHFRKGRKTKEGHGGKRGKESPKVSVLKNRYFT